MNQFRSSFLDSIPPVVKNLIIINALMWLATMMLSYTSQITLSDYLGLHYFQSQAFRPYQFITYMFMHGGFEHLFFNMFGLFIFGGILEQTFGQKRFLTYYMVTGIGAGIIQMLVYHFQIQAIVDTLPAEALNLVKTEGYELLQSRRNWIDPDLSKLNLLFNTCTVGASGSIFGILLAFGVMFPNMPLFILFIPVPVKAKYYVIVYGLLELYLGVANYSGDNIAHFAHLGGMLFGFFLIWKWRKKGI
jgi:membrane associated rhomboid family serine protease